MIGIDPWVRRGFHPRSLALGNHCIRQRVVPDTGNWDMTSKGFFVEVYFDYAYSVPGFEK
jgi:hypothetical protein